MKRGFQTAGALVLTLAVATAASADSAQLAASAGIDPAGGYSLTEIAVAKFNADTRRDDHVAIASGAVVADPAAHAQLFAAAGISPAEAEGMTLTDLAAAKRNRESRGDDRGRSYVGGGSNGNAQLIASIGLAPEVGRSMSLNDIYLEKIVRQSDDD